VDAALWRGEWADREGPVTPAGRRSARSHPARRATGERPPPGRCARAASGTRVPPPRCRQAGLVIGDLIVRMDRIEPRHRPPGALPPDQLHRQAERRHIRILREAAARIEHEIPDPVEDPLVLVALDLLERVPMMKAGRTPHHSRRSMRARPAKPYRSPSPASSAAGASTLTFWVSAASLSPPRSWMMLSSPRSSPMWRTP